MVYSHLGRPGEVGRKFSAKNEDRTLKKPIITESKCV